MLHSRSPSADEFTGPQRRSIRRSVGTSRVPSVLRFKPRSMCRLRSQRQGPEELIARVEESAANWDSVVPDSSGTTAKRATHSW